MKNYIGYVLRYVLPILVFIGFLIVSFLLPTTEIIKTIAAIPGVGALFVLLIQIWRDSNAHERALEIQNKQADYALGTASHMANVVYDKQVVFCEEYISRVQLGFQELLRDGPSKNSMNIGRELVNIRQKHSTWLTKEIEEKLIPFEQGLIKIGAHESVIDRLPPDERRIKMIDEIYNTFGYILGHEKPKTKEEEALAISMVIEHLRDVLGIKILTELRLEIANFALKRIERI